MPGDKQINTKQKLIAANAKILGIIQLLEQAWNVNVKVERERENNHFSELTAKIGEANKTQQLVIISKVVCQLTAQPITEE